MKKRVVLVPLVALLTTASGESAFGITLEEALAAAYINNPELKAQRASLRAEDEKVSQALSSWRPSVILTGESSYIKSATNSTWRFMKYRGRKPSQIKLEATQNLYSGGGSSKETRGAENDVLAQREKLKSTEQEVLFRAARGYIDLVREEAILDLRRSNEDVLKKQLEATRDRFRVGEITRTDVSLAEARLAQAWADRAQAVGKLEVARATFRSIVGLDPDSVSHPEREFAIPNDRDAAVALAADSSPDVLRAVYTERSARESVSVARAALAPTVDLVGAVTRSLNASSPGTRTDSYELKVVAKIPLYRGGQVYSRLRQTKQLASQARQFLAQARLNAMQQASSAWDQLKSVRARLVALEAQIKAAQIALEGVEREADVGARTILDVLDAKQELLDAQVALVEGKRDELVSEFSLIASMGQLTARDLKLDVQYYDPTINYNEIRHQLFGGDILETELPEPADSPSG